MGISSTFTTNQFPGAAISRVSIQSGRGHAGDEVMAILALMILPSEFAMAEPVRLPFLALFLGYACLHWQGLLDLVLKGRWLFALPVICILSALWADAPLAALRHGVIMLIAFVVAAALALRLDLKQLVVTLFISQLILCVGSFLNPVTMWVGGYDGGEALVGIFPHKNVLAQRVLLLALSSTVILMSAHYRPIFRVCAVAALGLALLLVAQAKAATAVILLAAVTPVAVIMSLIWRPAAHIHGLRSAIVMGGLSTVVLGLLVLINVFGINPVADGLAFFGKDSTLTGRTVIWQTGNKVITDNPLLGVGAGNFWHADNPTAVRLADRFWHADGRFWFHNTYYEVMVHLGAVGLIAAVYSYGRSILLIIGSWWRDQQGAEIFFVLLVAILFTRSLVESELFKAMSLSPLLLWTGAFSALLAKSPLEATRSSPAYS